MTATSAAREVTPSRSLVPARMDRLPWTRFHWLVVVGLGVSWILDGLEIQIVSLISAPLTDPKEVSSVVEKFRAKYAGDVKKYYSKFDVAVFADIA